MDVMYFNGIEKKSEQLVVRTLQSKACLENFDVKFNRTIQNAMHFESLFFYKGVAQ